MLFDVDLPKWANWVAQDENGSWFAYESEPFVNGVIWDAQEYINSAGLCDGIPPENFTLELYEVTWK